MQHLLNIITNNRAGKAAGIYSVCTAHPVVLEAALQQGKNDGMPVLIEATANQANQFGGYADMRPADFPPYLEKIAAAVGFPNEDIILGGDHLGPVCWVDEPSVNAMRKASDLIDAYVRAGFTKIHLDTSMPCADDPAAMSDELVAGRAAELCEVAENTADELRGRSDLVYVIGTEVPPPGGSQEALDGIRVTPIESARLTVDAHRTAFSRRGLDDAWSRVIGLVVQPGVEFDHTSVHDFVPEAVNELSALIDEIPNMVFEAHSTDYQSSAAYPELIKRHFAILKVGPQLTFALREALFALSHIEDELISLACRSNLREICEQVMCSDPGHWENYYPNDERQGRLYRRYSYSDRIRYYWNKSPIKEAVASMMRNLCAANILPPLLSLYMPTQYHAVKAGTLAIEPNELVRHHIMQVTQRYASACLNN